MKRAHGHAPLNGLKMYYEIEGDGDPLVFIPPAFGFAGLKSFPALAKSHAIITIDLQGNGRTADIPDRPISIEQYAEDVVALLKHLEISKADFLGESYGGNTAAMIAVRHPERVRRVATYSATFSPPPSTLDPLMTHYERPPTAETTHILFQRESYKKVAPDPTYWPRIHDKVASIQWRGFSKEDLAFIKAPMLIIQGDQDFVRLEHSVETVKLIPQAELAVIPSASHLPCLQSRRGSSRSSSTFSRSLTSNSLWQLPNLATNLARRGEDERVELACEIMRGLPADVDVLEDDPSRDELRRRIAAVQNGTATLIPWWDEAREMVRRDG